MAERERGNDVLEPQALRDSLTNLPNRILFQDRLQHAILTARRHVTSLALLVVDIDYFREINDTFGHRWGDVLLQQVGQRLVAAVRSSDTVARVGSDEFGVLLPGADGEGASLIARKLLRLMEQPVTVQGQSFYIEVSIGLCVYPSQSDDAETLLRRADIAMHMAKRSRLGYAVYAWEQDEYSPSRLALMGELREAVEQDQLFLHYQPKVLFKTGRIAGVEALARWQHPRLGVVPPDQFIPLAERTGLIKPLSRWVLGAALRQSQTWSRAGLMLPVAVNLSARNLHDPQLLGSIAALLATWGVPACWPSVEITESAMLANPERAIEIVGRLRDMGLRVAVDDFGTGYTSLAYLKRLPMHELKIDKSFVNGLAADEKDLAIVRATIDLGHSLGIQVVAEGVEDQATWDLLGTLGCDVGQGYYLSHPLPADELVHWLKQSPWGLEHGS